MSCSSNKDPIENKESLMPNEIKISQKIDNNTILRSALIRYPNSPNKDSYPVLMYFHGNGGNAINSLNQLQGLNSLVDDEEFIAIYLDGYLNSWNLGYEKSKANDVEFVIKVIEKIKELKIFDTSKIFAIGSSNGAGMVNKLGKETSFFNGIAPIISQQTDLISKIVPKKPLSVFQINGDSDQLIPIQGGVSKVQHIFLSAKESALNWAINFSCNLEPVETNSKWGEYNVQSFKYGNCNSNVKISYTIVENAKHQSLFGKDYNLYKTIWDFFNEN